jgi:tRNA pseudouridine32 synthase / 23S rRNA pseudouridine746 synthase
MAIMHPLSFLVDDSGNFPSLFNPLHPLAIHAVALLQQYLSEQTDFVHNFGLDSSQTGMVIGKMFGVLVVEAPGGSIGYLAAFSGKLAGTNRHDFFVPPIYDMLTEGSFFHSEEIEINALNQKISKLEVQLVELELSPMPQTIDSTTICSDIGSLKRERQQRSATLQRKIFEQYHIVNSAGKAKSLLHIFAQREQPSLPPAGAGECAAPKLLQFAFSNQLKPIAMTEFWWGTSPKSQQREHKEHYPACREKCGPILAYMLGDLGEESE